MLQAFFSRKKNLSRKPLRQSVDIQRRYTTEACTILKQLDLIFSDQEEHRRLLMQRGSLAQALLDLFQTLCDYPDVDKHLRSKISTAMIRLSKNSSLYPRCLALDNIEKIGDHPVAAGGFGEIWKGLLGGQLTCLKVVKVYGDSEVEKLMKEFLKEAILWRQLEHPNVLPFLGLYFLGASQQRICLISPWMENGNLTQYLKEDSEFTDRMILAYDVSCGLAYLHEKKVIHGDLKGVNILITASGRAAIADFGLSRLMESESFSSRSSSTVQGTARWLAPECLLRRQRLSYESDVYAFGCVCYEIFTNHLPFYHCAHDPAVVVELMNGNRPTRPLRLNDGIWSFMQDCWHEDPSLRPVTNTLPGLLDFIANTNISQAEDWSTPSNSRLWHNIRYPEMCPCGSELENFLRSGYLRSLVSRKPSFDSLPSSPSISIFHSLVADYATSPTFVSASPRVPNARVFYAMVVHDFEAQSPDELEATRGDPVAVVAVSNREWFIAKPIARIGWPGLIPVAFVELHDLTTGNVIFDVDSLIDSGELMDVEEWKQGVSNYMGYTINSSNMDSESTHNSIRISISVPQVFPLTPSPTSTTYNQSALELDDGVVLQRGQLSTTETLYDTMPFEHTGETDSTTIKPMEVPLEATTRMMLYAALKRYYFRGNWESYVMFIGHGPSDKRVERCLGYGEKPLSLYQKLRDSEQNPVFLIKHVKDIPSPSVVARRRVSLDPFSAPRQKAMGISSKHRDDPELRAQELLNALGDALVPLSYAVAIFPYLAEYEDEFDVAIGDMFIVLSRTSGWWVVLRDVDGSGNVNVGMAKSGRVPKGCFLETNIPIADAVSKASIFYTSVITSASSQPIAVSNVITKSFSVVALMDYQGREEEELDLIRGDELQAFKRCNHWTYVAKVESGHRGWVPSWLIGKVMPGTP